MNSSFAPSRPCDPTPILVQARNTASSGHPQSYTEKRYHLHHFFSHSFRCASFSQPCRSSSTQFPLAKGSYVLPVYKVNVFYVHLTFTNTGSRPLSRDPGGQLSALNVKNLNSRTSIETNVLVFKNQCPSP